VPGSLIPEGFFGVAIKVTAPRARARELPNDVDPFGQLASDAHTDTCLNCPILHA